MQKTGTKFFSSFSLNPETSGAPHGPPRGLINRYISLGLPPWAAWCYKLSKYSLYRMSDVKPRGFLPRHPKDMDVIWLNERVRERVRTSRSVQNVYRQLKYPHTMTGIHFSDILDHWVQVPMVKSAMFEVEKDGGFDNFILKRNGMELKSKYGERIRRHLLVRQKEIQKNFVLEKQAAYLASHIQHSLTTAQGKDEVEDVFAQYGVSKKQFLNSLALREFERRKKEQRPVDATAEAV